ncbi:MAG: iron ABC transporter permease [Tissierellia bacterium]|nr:iron ABC transporter permease [Tissierellia bacterium]
MNNIKNEFIKRRKNTIIITFVLTILMLILAITMLMYGNKLYSISTVIKVLTGQDIENAGFVIRKLRLPRMIAGILSGMALGIAGNTFQMMLRNPLASPDVLGIASGSSAAAVFCILILGMSGINVSIISIICGLITSLLIFLLSREGKYIGGKIILIGIGFQTVYTSIIMFILSKSNEYDIPKALRWLNGNLDNVKGEYLPYLFVVHIIFSAIILLNEKKLQILELGDEKSLSLGLDIKKSKFILMISSVLMISFAISITGPILFVAFLAGPIARQIVGKSNSSTIAAAMVGAIIVLSSDLIGQYLFATRYPVGVITGAIGTPYLIYQIIKMNNSGVSI